MEEEEGGWEGERKEGGVDDGDVREGGETTVIFVWAVLRIRPPHNSMVTHT